MNISNLDFQKETIPISTVANILGVSRRTVHNWVERGLMVKIPGTYRIARREVDRFLGEYTKPTTPADRVRGPYRSTREANARSVN